MFKTGTPIQSLFVALVAITLSIPTSGHADQFKESCQAIIKSVGAEDDGSRLNKLFALAWDHQMDEHPEWASYIGYPGHETEWTDNSAEAIERRKADNLLLREVIGSISREQLSEIDRLNYDLFAWRLTDDIDDDGFPSEHMQITQLGGVHQNVAQMLTMMPTTKVAEYENIIARLRGVPSMVDKTIALLEKGLKAGVTPPQVTLREVPTQILNQITEDPAEAPMLKSFSSFGPSILSEDRSRLKSEAYALYKDQVVPSLQELHSFVTDTYLPGCRTTIGASDLPNGEAWYAHLVKHYTTTDLTPKQIHNIGLGEVARIRKQMEVIIEQIEFE